MIEFGKTLKIAREAKGLSIKQVAVATHMMTQIVEGLENEDFSRIVAPIYGRGFVKLYCESVGLEPKPLVDAFMEIYSGNRVAKPKAEPPPREPPKIEPAGLASPKAEPPKVPPPEPVAAEPPPKPPELDFGHAPSSIAAPKTSRYAAPIPIGEESRFRLPRVNWRIAILVVASFAVIALFALGVRALYRATMKAPAEDAERGASAETPATDGAPTTPDAPAQATAATGRKPLPLKPFYLDSDHSTDTERK